MDSVKERLLGIASIVNIQQLRILAEIPSPPMLQYHRPTCETVVHPEIRIKPEKLDSGKIIMIKFVKVK